MQEQLEQIQEQARQAAEQLLEAARLAPGDILVVGCSTSEVAGRRIGTFSNVDIARAIFEGLYPPVQQAGLYLAAQCCEHLNRALILEREAARCYRLEPVNVVPQPKAGGSFATTAYQRFADPVAVESVPARAGMDIGSTLIGMHLLPVAVPLRLECRRIGEAPVVFARTRPKFIGGARAVYDDRLL